MPVNAVSNCAVPGLWVSFGLSSETQRWRSKAPGRPRRRDLHALRFQDAFSSLSLPSVTMKWNGVLRLDVSVLFAILLEIKESRLLSRYSDWLRAGRQRGRSSSPGRVNNFALFIRSSPVLGFSQPPIQWLPWALSPGVKRPGREADDSPPTSAEVKNGGSIHPLPHTPSWRVYSRISGRLTCS
jgi:hypothetical protein